MARIVMARIAIHTYCICSYGPYSHGIYSNGRRTSWVLEACAGVAEVEFLEWTVGEAEGVALLVKRLSHLYSYGRYSYGLYSYGIHNYGLYNYGTYSYGYCQNQGSFPSRHTTQPPVFGNLVRYAGSNMG